MTYPLAAVVGGDVWATGDAVALASPESCTDSGDHTTYQAATHMFWDWTATFTVQNSPDGSTSWTTVTDYTFQWATGKLIFNTVRTNTFTRISAGSYFTSTQLDATYSYQVTVKIALKDTTSFQASGGWQQNTSTIKMASVKIQTYRNDNRLFSELGKYIGLQLYLDKPNNIRWQFFATPTDLPTDAQTTGIETMTATFISMKDVYFLTS